MVGVSRQTIANIELGRHEPGVLLGMAIATVLRVSIHDLFRPLVQTIGQIRRYRFHAGPRQAWNPYMSTPYMLIPPITAEALTKVLSGVVVRGLVTLPANQGYHVEVQLDRPSHEQALDEIEQVIGQFGLQLVEAYIVEVSTAAVETAIAAGAGGGLLGSSTKDAGATLAGALIGLAVGAAVGSQIERVVAAYTVTKSSNTGSWELIPIPLRQPNNGGAETGT
jgi:hypothetical protein